MNIFKSKHFYVSNPPTAHNITSSKMCYTAVVLTAITVLVGYYVMGLKILIAENGLLENMQAFICLLAGLTFLIATKRVKGDFRLFTLFFGFLALAFILREVDVERLNLPDWIIMIGSGTGRNILYAFVFIPLIVVFFSRVKHYYDLGLAYLWTASGKALVAVAVFLLLSDVFERMPFNDHVLVEELLELLGYGAFWVAGILARNLEFSKRT